MASRGESRGLWVGVLAASFLACGGLLVLVFGTGASRSDARDAGIGAATLPPPAGAFASGGVPASGPPVVRRTFATLLPRFVIAVDALAAAHHAGADKTPSKLVVDSAKRNLRGSDVTAALGDGASRALTRVLDAAEAAAVSTDATADSRADALTDAMHALNASLGAANLGFAIDTDVRDDDSGRRFVLVFSFTVERVRLYRAGAHAVRTVQLRRIDELGWHYNLLGFTTADRREALVMLDQVETRLVERVLPQLADDAPPFYSLAPDTNNKAWSKTLMARAKRVIRRAYGDSAAAPEHATTLGTLLAQRKRLLAKLAQQVTFTKPRGLDVPPLLMKNLEALIAPADAKQLEKLQAELAAKPVRAAYNHTRDLLVSSIERHEAQHRVDQLASAELTMPAALEAMVGGVRNDAGKPVPRAMRARGELSAYLSEIARDPTAGAVSLSIVTQFAVDSDFWGTAECYASLVALRTLAAAAKVGHARPLVVNGLIDRAAVTELYVALTDLPPTQLSAAAQAGWKSLFGRDLAPLELVR